MVKYKDSIELTDGFKVSVVIDDKAVNIKWSRKPPYSKETLEAIVSYIVSYIDPWILNAIKHAG